MHHFWTNPDVSVGTPCVCTTISSTHTHAPIQATGRVQFMIEAQFSKSLDATGSLNYPWVSWVIGCVSLLIIIIPISQLLVLVGRCWLCSLMIIQYKLRWSYPCCWPSLLRCCIPLVGVAYCWLLLVVGWLLMGIVAYCPLLFAIICKS